MSQPCLCEAPQLYGKYHHLTLTCNSPDWSYCYLGNNVFSFVNICVPWLLKAFCLKKKTFVVINDLNEYTLFSKYVTIHCTTCLSVALIYTCRFFLNGCSPCLLGYITTGDFGFYPAFIFKVLLWVTGQDVFIAGWCVFVCVCIALAATYSKHAHGPWWDEPKWTSPSASSRSHNALWGYGQRWPSSPTHAEPDEWTDAW